MEYNMNEYSVNYITLLLTKYIYTYIKKIMGDKIMNKKILIIILSIIFVAMAIGVTYIVFFNEHYENVQISNSASISMPVGKGIKSEWINGTDVYHTHNEKASIMCYNSQNNNHGLGTVLGTAMGFTALKAQYCNNVENQIVETTINGTTYYSIATGNDSTHDNIIISSKDKDTTMKIYKSIKYSAVNGTNNNTTINNTAGHVNNNTTNQQTNNNQQTNDNQQTNNNNGQSAADKARAEANTYSERIGSSDEVAQKRADAWAYYAEHGEPAPW